jgi:serine/threonine protein phosphatase PrpC
MPYRSAPGRAAVVDFAGATITGRNREVNEDAWAAVPGAGVFLVADGCGGLSSGRAAADIALSTIERVFSTGSPTAWGLEPLSMAIDEANRRVSEAAVGKQRGMGAALAALRVAPPWVVTSIVGDCRVYRYRVGSVAAHEAIDARGGVLTRLTTEDALWVSMLRSDTPIEKVVEAYKDHPNVITKALGTNPRIDVRVEYARLEPGDLYLVCSDGVTSQLEDREIRACISPDAVPLPTRCERLLQASDERVGHDNATAVLVQC